MNTYVCFFENQRVELRAHNHMRAKYQASELMKVPKSMHHMVRVVLAARADADTVYVKQELL